MSWEDSRSVRKEPTSMECSGRKEWSVGGGSGAGFIDYLVKTGKWSDGDQWVQETAGASNVSEEVMTRSRRWFLSCVGKWTCWLRLKEERRDRNWEVRGVCRIIEMNVEVTGDDKFMGTGCSKRQKRTEVIEENREWFGISGRGWRTIDIEDW